MNKDIRIVDIKLEDLKRQFGAQLKNKTQQMARLFDEVCQHPYSQEAFEAFYYLAHRLAGSAGTFGYADIGEVARKIETCCETIPDFGTPERTEWTTKLNGLMIRLEQVIDATVDRHDNVHLTSDLTPATRRRNVLIAIVDSDEDQAQALAVQIEEAGYRVRVFLEPDTVVSAIEETPPAAILMGLNFTRGRKYGIKLAQKIRTSSKAGIPLIIVSANDQFLSRLEAFRAGAVGYFVKPPILKALIDQLDQAVLGQSARPCHVLVLTNDESISSELQSILNADGMVVTVLHDVDRVFETLQRFQPELILADIQMRQCTGLELAHVIRQDPINARLPILFLTKDNVSSKMLLELGLEKGDFLEAPFVRDEVLELLAFRAQWARAEIASLSKDNLFKVLNRRTELDRFNRELQEIAHPTPLQPTSPSVEGTSTRKVLVVDDDPYIRRAIKLYLEGCGADVLEACDGEQGFEIAYWDQVDLIITDYFMPKATGEHLLNRLRSKATTKDIPVIVMTQHMLEGRRDYALERDMLGRLGATAYLQKPFKLDALITEVRKHVAFTDPVPQTN
jgi:CheY-like chemotaxis protein